jgi:hypothetical protein
MMRCDDRVTTTDNLTLIWERTHGAHAGVTAEYGDWQFRVYQWQRGSYLATATNARTGQAYQLGNYAGECPTLETGKRFCEARFRHLRDIDRENGIRRG